MVNICQQSYNIPSNFPNCPISTKKGTDSFEPAPSTNIQQTILIVFVQLQSFYDQNQFLSITLIGGVSCFFQSVSPTLVIIFS